MSHDLRAHGDAWWLDERAPETAHGAPGKRTLTLALQRRPASTGAAEPGAGAGPAVPGLGEVLSARGHALPFLSELQAAFGHHDLRGVQAHSDGQAATVAASLGAEAFATGGHVGFASPPLLHTVAHEAAHVVQQRSAHLGVQGLGAADDEHERHADAVADRVVRGQSAVELLDRYHPGGGGGDAVVQLRRLQRAEFSVSSSSSSADPPGLAPLLTRLAALADGFDPADLPDADRADLRAAIERGRFVIADATLRATVLAELSAPRPMDDGSGEAKAASATATGSAGTAAATASTATAAVAPTAVDPLAALRAQVAIFARVADVPADWGRALFPSNRHGVVGPKLIVQAAVSRGDMHDIRAALHLDPTLRVLIGLPRPDVGVDDARTIVAYYQGLAGFAQRVAIVVGDPGATRATLGGQSASDATKILALVGATYRATDRAGPEVGQLMFEQDLADATTGPTDDADDAAYLAELQARGFTASTPYVLINHRESGHEPGPGRPATHPELDTGAAGFWDLAQAVVRSGRVPVPMGTAPGLDAWPGPSLIDYHRWPVCTASARRNKRQAEYYLLRALRLLNPSVTALAWRSGVTDAIAFAGIPVLALDTARSSGGVRAKSREELFFDGHYQQVNLSDRDDPEQAWNAAAIGVAGWIGALTPRDLEDVVAALGGDALRPLGRDKRRVAAFDQFAGSLAAMVAAHRPESLAQAMASMSREQRAAALAGIELAQARQLLALIATIRARVAAVVEWRPLGPADAEAKSDAGPTSSAGSKTTGASASTSAAVASTAASATELEDDDYYRVQEPPAGPTAGQLRGAQGLSDARMVFEGSTTAVTRPAEIAGHLDAVLAIFRQALAGADGKGADGKGGDSKGGGSTSAGSATTAAAAPGKTSGSHGKRPAADDD